jgi:multiple sugar transport system permease protein
MSAPTAITPNQRSSKRPASALHRNRGRTGMFLSFPAFALVGLLLGIPIVQACYYSMTRWDGLVATWIGPSTYVKEFKNPIFWRVLENNGLLLLAVPVAIVIPLGIAAILHERVFGWRFFRSIYFLPTAVSAWCQPVSSPRTACSTTCSAP